MARTNNLENFLTDVANAIRVKTNNIANIPAANFDTEITNIITPNNQDKVIAPSISIQTIQADNGYTGLGNVTINAVTSNIDPNIIPEYIQSGRTILGVTGNMQSVRNQDKMITVNGVYSADQGYTGLGTVTVNVPNSGGGSGDIKSFVSKQAMDSDENAQLGDKALIYAEVSTPVDENSEFSSCTFPNTVVLDSTYSGTVWGSFRSTGDSYFDGYVEVSSSSFRFEGWGDEMVMVEYDSQDGITYTRTDGGEELQEFGTTIKWEDMGDPFDSVIGEFMKIQTVSESALYEYKSVRDEDYIQYATNLAVTGDEVDYTYETYYAKDVLDILKANCVDTINHNNSTGFLLRSNVNEYIFVYTSVSDLYIKDNKLYFGGSSSATAMIATINISNDTINISTTTIEGANTYLSNIDISSVVVARNKFFVD